MNFVKTYAKSLLAVAVTALTAVVGFWGGGVTAAEWANVILAAAGAAVVFTAPNVPGAKYTKAVLAVVTAVAAFLVTAVVGGLDGPELLQVLVLAAGALGVYGVKNTAGGVNLSDTGSVGRVG